MKTVMKVGASAAIVIATASMTAALGETPQGFARFAGGWSGQGSVRMTSGIEPIRCRGAYAPSGEQLRLNLTCASDSFKVQIASDMMRQGDRVQGTWSEATFGVSGNLTGSVQGDRIDAAISGPGVSGRLSLTLRGNLQTVSLVTQSSQISGTANVTLHRR